MNGGKNCGVTRLKTRSAEKSEDKAGSGNSKRGFGNRGRWKWGQKKVGWGPWRLGAGDWRCSRLGMPETEDAGDAGDQGRWQWGTLQGGVAANWDRWNLVKPEMGNWWAGISEKGDHGRWVLEKKDAGKSDQ